MKIGELVQKDKEKSASKRKSLLEKQEGFLQNVKLILEAP